VINLVYYLELPFFEQYKIVKAPWPWKTDEAEEWWALYYKTIKRVALN
jgi:hypothetical protein